MNTPIATSRTPSRSDAEAAQAVQAFTDGACLGNPGPGGWAALLRYGGRERELSGGEPDSTNNRMELLAAIRALESLTRPCTIDLYTDSKYVQQGIQSWLPRWRSNGWRTSAGKPVKNQDLWQRLSEAAAAHAVRWHWVRGHSGHVENERVDELARQAAQQQPAGARR